MKITTQTGLVGFLLTLATLYTPTATATPTLPPTPVTGPTTPNIESRLNRLTDAIHQREMLLPESSVTAESWLIAGGFANGSGRGGWANRSGGGGWVNGGGGGRFVNANPWRNAWVNGGGFRNYRY